MKTYVKLSVAGIACMLASSLVACGAETDALEKKTGGLSGSSSASGSASPDSPSPDTAEPADAIQTEPAAAEDCLLGTWVTDNAFFLAGMKEFGEEPQSVEGEVLVTYGEDGSLTTDYQGWKITFITEGITTVVSRNGIDLGAFEATESTVSLRDTQVGSELLLSGGGVEMPIAPDPVNYADAAYTCTAENASVATVDGEMRLTRR